MSREVHVRFWEHAGVKLPRASRFPLHRQAEIYARSDIDLPRSTLADMVGQAARLLRPLVDALAKHVMSGERVHADDTTVPVLEPGLGKTRTGRLWVYVRDDRPFAGPAPPAALYHYTPDRKGEHPRQHLREFRGHGFPSRKRDGGPSCRPTAMPGSPDCMATG